MRNFDILDVKLEAIQKVGKAARTPSQSKMLVDLALGVLDDLIARDRYADAVNVGGTAVAAARNTLDPSILERVLSRRQQIEALAQAHAAMEPFLAKLAQDPTDAEANLAIGRFRCLLKGAWSQGLPMLAIGGEGASARLAAQELRGTASAVELANGWWELAENEQEAASQQLRAHAAHWYQQALPELNGETKATALTRINGSLARSEQKG